MRSTVSALAVSALLVGFGSAAQAQTCTGPNVQKSPVPITSGHVIFYSTGRDAYYIYDFAMQSLQSLNPAWPTASTPLTGLENPKFSSKGDALLFAAIANYPKAPSNDQQQYHVFYLPLQANENPPAPPIAVNLTGPADTTSSDNYNLRNEDPAFSPDGTLVVWKQNWNIVISELTFNQSGSPNQLKVIRRVTEGATNQDATEASEPTFSRTGKYIYYQTGNSSFGYIQLHKYDYRTKKLKPMDFPQIIDGNYPTVDHYYYATTPNLYGLMYVSFLPIAQYAQYDKITLYAGTGQTPFIWNATDCSADNSDPAPVDEDFFIYSRRPNTPKANYELYVGQLSTGFSWQLSANFRSPISNPGYLYASNYTPY